MIAYRLDLTFYDKVGSTDMKRSLASRYFFSKEHAEKKRYDLESKPILYNYASMIFTDRINKSVYKVETSFVENFEEKDKILDYIEFAEKWPKEQHFYLFHFFQATN